MVPFGSCPSPSLRACSSMNFSLCANRLPDPQQGPRMGRKKRATAAGCRPDGGSLVYLSSFRTAIAPTATSRRGYAKGKNRSSKTAGHRDSILLFEQGCKSAGSQRRKLTHPGGSSILDKTSGWREKPREPLSCRPVCASAYFHNAPLSPCRKPPPVGTFTPVAGSARVVSPSGFVHEKYTVLELRRALEPPPALVSSPEVRPGRGFEE